MITTIHGEMDESTLRKVEGLVDNDNEHTTWVEYYQGDELVHRSAHVTLKQGLGIESAIGQFNG
jgi:hypothetical protein